MEFQLEFCKNYFLVKATGHAEIEVFVVMLKALFQHKDWRPGMSYIVDYTNLDARKITTDDVRLIAQKTKNLRDEAGVMRSSIVAPQDLQFGLVRMWSVYIDNNDEKETSVFRTLQEAIDWALTSS